MTQASIIEVVNAILASNQQISALQHRNAELVIISEMFAIKAALELALEGKASTTYVDNAALGIVSSWKVAVRLKTTGNVTLSGEQTIDGTLTSGDDILVGSNTNQTQNGIYTTGAGAWTRRSDADTALKLRGAAVTVEEGATFANTTWVQTTDSIVLGSSNIVWGPLGTSVQDATNLVKGILKLYATAGANTDGTITQAVITSLLGVKQDALVSGTNIKSINSGSLLGSGNIDLLLTSSIKENIVPTGDIDGVNNIFTFPHTPIDLKLWVDQARLTPGTDFTRVNAVVTILGAPPTSQIIGDYRI